MVKTVFKTGSEQNPTAEFVVEFAPGESVFQEGDLGTEMYIVLDGTIEILKTVGGQETTLAEFEKGDFFGEMAVLDDLPRTASARAATPSRLLQINGSTFDQMLLDNPEIAVRMLRKLSRRLRETHALLTATRGDVESSSLEAAPLLEETRKRKAPEKLVHSGTGKEYFLSSGSESTVGRHDPVTGIHPDVDLSEVDTDRSTSRRHAKVYRRGKKFFVTEEIGTTNGTFVNGNKLETGVPFEFEPGDEVQFGLVKMIFRE